MGFKDVFNKVIGADAIDEEYTEDEMARAKEAVKREAEEKPAVMPFAARSFSATSSGFAAASSGSAASNTGDGAKNATATRPTYAGITSTKDVMKVVLIEPKGFEECPKLVDSLKGRRPVIINLEKVETETAKKIFDFLSGATYALNGSVQKIANNIFIFTPESVDVAYNEGRSFEFAKEQQSPWKR